MLDKLKQVGQLKQMRDQAMQMQRQLDAQQLTVEKNGITIVITASQKIISITTNGRADNDIKDAVNEAIKKSQEIAAKAMQGMMGGMDSLKGLFGR